MRVPEGINNIAVFGATCVGKSTVADELASLLGWEVRHCGEILKEKADLAGTPVANLSLQDHKEVDGETLDLATRRTKLVMEGGFLDAVLIGRLEKTIFIRLSCAEKERQRRFESKHPAGTNTLQERDEQDAALRKRLYGDNPITDHAIIDIETSATSPKQTALELRNAVERLHDLA